MLCGEAILPGAMAVLAATLSILLLAYTTPPGALAGIVLVGYLAHAATKACLLIGENGYMPPLVAGGVVPLALLAGIWVAFGVSGLARRKAGRPNTRPANRSVRNDVLAQGAPGDEVGPEQVDRGHLRHQPMIVHLEIDVDQASRPVAELDRDPVVTMTIGLKP